MFNKEYLRFYDNNNERLVNCSEKYIKRYIYNVSNKRCNIVSSQVPIILMKEGTTETKDKDAQRNNITT